MWKIGDPDMEQVWPRMVLLLTQELGADPNLLDWDFAEDRETPLMWALRAHSEPGDAEKSLPTVAALLLGGADPNWRDSRGWTPVLR